MKLQIDEKLSIQSYEHGWMLCEKREKVTAKKGPFNVLGYYATLVHAAQAVLDRKLAERNAEGLATAVEAIREARDAIVAAVRKFRPEDIVGTPEYHAAHKEPRLAGGVPDDEEEVEEGVDDEG